MKCKVYGYSDDLVEVEGEKRHGAEIECYDSDVFVRFKDGTEIKVTYGKPGYGGVWGITVENKGSAEQKLTECFDEDADVYSDIFEIDAEVMSYMVVEKEA